MIMMIAPNSVVRQMEEAQGTKEEEARYQIKRGERGTQTPGTDDPSSPSRLRMSYAKNIKKTWIVGRGT